MNAEIEGTNKISDEVISLAKTVAEPFYKDAISPAAKEIGKGFETVAKTINVALSPLKVAIWGYDRIEEYLQNKLSKKLENIPQDKIQTPEAHIAVPTIEALRYTGSNPELSELFLNLLATSMNVEKASYAHPAFVKIISEITSDEARLLKAISVRYRDSGESVFPILYIEPYEAGFHSKIIREETVVINNLCVNLDNPYLLSNYMDNLFRLALVVTVAPKVDFSKEYKKLKKSDKFLHEINIIKNDSLRKVNIREGCWSMGAMGRQFCNVCIPNE
ncbi:MAG: hypothetical protein C0622_03135 [Desulfuromonas sp.]|nr:MAG: hypothetical protein C0622_03135 [Desulfuromonas sp.]